ncbi:MAG: hypothetical protein NWF04_04015 [Candidatus Bathyarchaeota archaeon]|nr:hypothetical protein [Candidatus Bathyarchaeota archaeon]
MKFALSNRVWAVLFVAVLVFSGVNTYLILDRTNTLQAQRDQDYAELNHAYTDLNQRYTALNQTYTDFSNLFSSQLTSIAARLPIEQYDYVLYQDNGAVLAKNGRTGNVDFNNSDASFVFNQALTYGSSVYIKAQGTTYNLTSDVYVNNKKNARLDSDGATLVLNGGKIIVAGETYEQSQNNQVSGFKIVNGTLRIENSFQTTVANMIFESCVVGVELANTDKWTECTKIDTVHFNMCTQGLVFRTNTSNYAAGKTSTGSYTNTQITRCYFNLRDNATAITVEPHAEFTDSQLCNIRIWVGEFDHYNQTGLQMDGSMYQTLLDNVVFESFANGDLNNALIYAIKLGGTAYQSPNLQSGVNFLGRWTARIYNPHGNWVFGAGGVFKQENLPIQISPSSYGEPTVVQMRPATITSFKPQITVQGSFDQNETITVRVRLEFIDNTLSNPIEKTFTTTNSTWLTDNDLLTLFPSQNLVYAILIDAKTNTPTTTATATVSLYGTTA